MDDKQKDNNEEPILGENQEQDNQEIDNQTIENSEEANIFETESQEPEIEPVQQENQTFSTQTNITTTNEVSVKNKVKETKEKKPKFTKKKLIITLVILLLVAGGAVAYYYMQQKDDKTPAGNSANSNQTNDDKKEEAKEIVADTIAYAFSSKTGDPYGLFWRPAGSGERTDAKLSYPTITHSDVLDQKVVVSAQEGSGSTTKEVVIYSEDGGKSYKKIFDGKSSSSSETFGDQVTSLKLSSDGSRVAIGIVTSSSDGKAVEINPSNSESKDIIVAENGVIFVYGYDASSGNLVYTEGCYNCDGNLGNEIYVVNTKSKAKKTIAKSTDTNLVQPIGVTKDFSRVLVLNTTKDNSIKPDGLYDFYIGPPYSLDLVKIKDLTKTSLAPFGTKLALNSQSTVPDIFKTAGFLNDGLTPYYAYDSSVSAYFDNQKPTTLFTADKSLVGVHYVSEAEVITSSGVFADFKLTNYKVKSKELISILNGDDNTSIFGVTTK